MERSEIQEAGFSPVSALLHLGYVVASLHSFSVDTASRVRSAHQIAGAKKLIASVTAFFAAGVTVKSLYHLPLQHPAQV